MHQSVKLLKDGKFLGYYPSKYTGYNPLTLKGLYTNKPSYWNETSIARFKEYLKEELSQAISVITVEYTVKVEKSTTT
jgi:hypothetical protein